MRSGVESSTDAPPYSDAALSIGLAAAGFVLVVVLTAVSAVSVSDRGWDAARIRGEAAAEQAAVRISAAMAEAASAVDTASRVSPGDEGSAGASPASVRSIGRVLVDGDPSDRAELDALAEDPAVRTALARARDSGELVLSAPTASSPATSVLVRALYRSAGEATNEATAQTASVRRAELVGHVVGVIDADVLVAADEPDRLQLSDGDVVLGGPGELSGPVVEAVVPVLDRRWRVANAFEPPSTLLVWLIVASGTAAAFAVVAAARSGRSAVARGRAEAERAKDRAEAVVAYAGVVQESHDLGEVLPALAVQLSDRLGLAGVSLSVATDAGSLREVFVHGDAPDPSAPAVSVLPVAAAPGETVAVHLRRAERSTGVLRVCCGEPLDAGDFDEVRIVGELVTATVVASRSAEQSQEAVDRLRMLDELKTTFLGTASHELRTPVTAISGFASMLSQRWESLPDDNRRVFADRIASNARVLEALVQDLLDFARLERGELKLVLETVDLAAVANRVLDRLEPVWSSHTVRRSIAPRALVTGDVAALERVVTNLVSNAVKFSPTGSEVTVSVDDGSGVRLTVDDEGPGVPSVDRDRIFVRFFRGGGDEVVRTSGVGIGLSVVQDYVMQMGGRIHVQNSPAGGARFMVELARYDEQQAARQESSDATA